MFVVLLAETTGLQTFLLFFFLPEGSSEKVPSIAAPPIGQRREEEPNAPAVCEETHEIHNSLATFFSMAIFRAVAFCKKQHPTRLDTQRIVG